MSNPRENSTNGEAPALAGQRPSRRQVVCRVEELPPGQRKIVDIGGRTVGVFNINGRFYALLNRCPHKAAPLCQGILKGLVLGPEPYRYEIEREGEILRCPWHGWEFDVTTGRSIYNPHRVRARVYDVTIEALEEDPTVESFPVTVERQAVVLHI